MSAKWRPSQRSHASSAETCGLSPDRYSTLKRISLMLSVQRDPPTAANTWSASSTALASDLAASNAAGLPGWVAGEVRAWPHAAAARANANRETRGITLLLEACACGTDVPGTCGGPR